MRPWLLSGIRLPNGVYSAGSITARGYYWYAVFQNNYLLDNPLTL